MRIIGFLLAVVIILATPSCSRNSRTANELPFEVPAGWKRTDSKFFPAFQNPHNPGQSFRYIVLRFERPPRLTERQILDELQSHALDGPLVVEKLDRDWFAEDSAETSDSSGMLFRRRFILVEKTTPTSAVMHSILFFCSITDAESSKPAQELLRQSLREARLSK